MLKMNMILQSYFSLAVKLAQSEHEGHNKSARIEGKRFVNDYLSSPFTCSIHWFPIR